MGRSRSRSRRHEHSQSYSDSRPGRSRRHEHSQSYSDSRACRSRSLPRRSRSWRKDNSWKSKGWKSQDWGSQGWSSHDWNNQPSSQEKNAVIQPTQLGEPLVFEPEAGAGSCQGAVIFLHGLGDKPKNWSKTFAPLRAYSSQSCWLWIHLRAPKVWHPCRGHKLPAWASVLSKDCMHVGSEDHEDRTEQGRYQSAAEAVRLEVERLHQEYRVPLGKVLIAGFSQGAAVSLLAALTYPDLFFGCIVLSGWLLPCARDLLAAGKIQTCPPILLCHGTADDSIGHDCAEHAASCLRSAGQQLQFESLVDLGHAHSHACSASLIKILIDFLRTLADQELQASRR